MQALFNQIFTIIEAGGNKYLTCNLFPAMLCSSRLARPF